MSMYLLTILQFIGISAAYMAVVLFLPWLFLHKKMTRFSIPERIMGYFLAGNFYIIYLVFLIVCFGASIVGAICGIGGGVIIKPVLDSFGVLDVTAISFLSGCTVLSMTTYSVLKNKISGESHVTMKTGFPLAIGAAVG